METNRHLRPTITLQRTVMVLREKHGDRYFVVDNDEELHQTALAVVRQRLKEGWYYEPDEPKKSDLDYTKEDVAKLPVSLQKEASRKLECEDILMEYYRDEKKRWDLVNQACSQADGKTAWVILLDTNIEVRKAALVKHFRKIGFNLVFVP